MAQEEFEYDEFEEVRLGKLQVAKYLILWGTVVFVFFLSDFIFFRYTNLKIIPGIQFWIFPIGLIAAILNEIKTKNEVSLLITEKVFVITWMAVTVSIGAWTFLSVSVPFEQHIRLITLLFGLAAFIPGGSSGFVPSIVGGIVGIIISAMPEFGTPNYELFAAIGICCSCVIPGIILYSTERKRFFSQSLIQ